MLTSALRAGHFENEEPIYKWIRTDELQHQ